MNVPQKLALGLLPLALVGTSCSGGGECDDAIALPPPPGIGGFGDFAFELRRDVYLGGEQLTGTAWHDLNGDGLQDVLELSVATSQLVVGLGLADGTFLEAQVLQTPELPWALELGDFDGDGRTDVAVGCLSDPLPAEPTVHGQLALFLQDEFGDLALVDTTPLAGAPRDLHRLVAGGGDFDSAGRDDLLAALREAGAVQRLRWEAGAWVLMGELSPATAGLADSVPLTVTTLDLEGDGDVDVVVGEDELVGAPDRIVAYRGDGFGGFLPAEVVLPIAAGPMVEGAGDVDGDGFDDLSVAQHEGSSALLLRGSEAGLTTIDEVEFDAALGGAVWDDLDGDGLFDVAASLVFEQAIAVRYQSAGTPTLAGLVFEPATAYNVGWAPHDLTVRDLPDPIDGLPDLVCANAGDVSILFNQGDRRFLAARGHEVGGEPRGVTVRDLDQDGNPDAIVLDQYQKQAVILRGLGDGTFATAAEVPLDPTLTETPGHAVVADFDGDGLEDVLVSVFDADEVRLLRNPGASLAFGTPSLTDATPTGSEPLGMGAADFDGDGLLDVLVANSADNTVRLLKGDGAGGFTPLLPFLLGAETRAVLAGDLDGDGLADAAVTLAESDGTDPRLAILKGDGAGGLENVASFPLGAVSSTIQSGDLDLDGDLDLVFGQSTVFTDEVTILLNQGALVFTSQTLAVGDDPGSLTIADVDDDGDADLVVPVGSGELRLALGDGTGAFPEVVPLPDSPFSLPVPYGIRSSAFSDLDGDGLADLLMVSPDSRLLWVGRNLGSTESDI